MQATFQNQFFANPMKQNFNAKVMRFVSDEDEPAIRKYLRAIGKI